MTARFLVLAGSCLLLAGSARAQAGLRVGGSLLAFNNYFAEQAPNGAQVNTSGRLGYQIGVFYQVQLKESPYLSLVPELQFSHEQQTITVKYDLTDVRSSSEYRLNLSYLNVPLLLRLTLGPLQLEAGPQGSVLLNGRGEGLTTGFDRLGNFRQPIDQPATDRYRRFDAGLCLGVGAKLPCGLGLNVRCYQGIVQVNRPPRVQALNEIPYSGNEEFRQTLQASLTYQLPTH